MRSCERQISWQSGEGTKYANTRCSVTRILNIYHTLEKTHNGVNAPGIYIHTRLQSCTIYIYIYIYGGYRVVSRATLCWMHASVSFRGDATSYFFSDSPLTSLLLARARVLLKSTHISMYACGTPGVVWGAFHERIAYKVFRCIDT